MYARRPKATYEAHRAAPTQAQLFVDEPTGLDDPDDRWTPRWFIDELPYKFTLDAAASSKNAVCKRYFDKAKNGLLQSWTGEYVWCNPPYSDIAPWAGKAFDEVRWNGCHLVAMLVPANRTEQPWWQDWIEPIRDGRATRHIRITTKFLRGRLQFGNVGSDAKQPPFGCVLIIFEPPAKRTRKR